jgi:glutaminyl-tRNA synthetase
MTEAVEQRHFIQQIIDADIESGKWGTPGDRTVVTTRFPPEPNGKFNLRFDDTNPAKEEVEFVDSIKYDLQWLGAQWDGEVCFASDYFGKMYDWAVDLINKDLAYVDESTPEEIRSMRGSTEVPGTNSPFRDRPTSESIDLFAQMKDGKIDNGKMVLRAKIDMAHSNMNMRDPVMYRVVNTPHHRTGDQWHIYPMYDWAHGLEDSIEGVTHSLCSLEFEDHRPLYNWFIESINKGNSDPIHHPQQIEFSRLAISYTNMSKRDGTTHE